MQVRDRREELLPELVEEQRSVHCRLSLPGVGTELRPAHTGAVAIRGRDLVEVQTETADELRQRRQEREAVVVGEDLGVTGRKRVPALGRGGVDVVDGDVAPDGLVLEPFTRVALVAASALGQVDRGERTVSCKRPVPAQPISEIHGMRVLGTQDRGEDPLRERGGAGVGRVGGDVGRGHGSAPLLQVRSGLIVTPDAGAPRA